MTTIIGFLTSQSYTSDVGRGLLQYTTVSVFKDTDRQYLCMHADVNTSVCLA